MSERKSPFKMLMQQATDAGTWEAVADEMPMRVIEALEDAEDLIAQLQAIVDHLPKTADGVPAYKDMPVWCVMPDGSIYDTYLGWYTTLGTAFAHEMTAVSAGYRLPNGVWRDEYMPVDKCYSTLEAAQAAKAGAK